MAERRDPRTPAKSQLFMLRLWPEEMGTGAIDWRGSVRHVTSGEVRYFRDWETLEAFVNDLLRGCGGPGPLPSGGAEAGRAPAEGSEST